MKVLQVCVLVLASGVFVLAFVVPGCQDSKVPLLAAQISFSPSPPVPTGSVSTTATIPHEPTEWETGPDLSCGTLLLSSRDRPAKRRFWRPLGLRIARRVNWLSISRRISWMEVGQAVNNYIVPRLPKQALLMIAGAAAAEVAKRETCATVESLPSEVQPKAWELVNATTSVVQLKVLELQSMEWDVKELLDREIKSWLSGRSGQSVDKSTVDVLLRDLIELYVKVAMKGWAEVTEEGVSKMLPDEMRIQLQILDGVVKKLERKGLAALTITDLSRLTTGGNLPPQMVMNSFLLMAQSSSPTAGYDMSSNFEDLTLGSIFANLNRTDDVRRAATYTALAAEAEAIDVVRDALDWTLAGSQSLFDGIEEGLRGFAQFPWGATATNWTRTLRASLTEGVSSGFDQLVDPTKRGLPKPAQLLPWATHYASTWNKLNHTAVAEGREDERGEDESQVEVADAEAYV